MITDEQRLKLDRLSKLFLNEFEKAFASLPYKLEFTDNLEVCIPAKDSRVGDMRVWLDEDEVIVGIGELFHTHFETYLDDSITKQQAEIQAVTDAVKFIKDILKDQVVIETHYKGKEPVRASIQYLDEDESRSVIVVPVQRKKGTLKRTFSSKTRIEKILWSGKKVE